MSLENASCRIGTDEALYWTMIGGCTPVGMRRRIVCEIEETSAIAFAMFTSGWKKSLMTATPSNELLSKDLRSPALPAMAYSLNWVICCSNCEAGRPV